MSPAANAISDELTLAGSLRACEAGLVSRHRANIRLPLRDANLSDIAKPRFLEAGLGGREGLAITILTVY